MDYKNTLLENLHQRRSIRKFTDKAVSREDITDILEAGRWAPSGLNNQPWRFLVIHKDDPRADELAECTKYGHIVRAAKVMICIFLDRSNVYSEVKDHQCIGACIQNMLLAAHSLRLGTVWLGEIINQKEQVMKKLDLSPDKYELQAVIAAGHPDQNGSSKRKDLSELMLEDY